MSTSQILQHLYSLDTSSPDFLRHLHCLIRNDEEEDYLSSLQGSELVRLVNFLDTTLSVIPGTDQISRQCLHKLQTICGQRTTLPSSYKVSGGLSRVGDSAVAYGGFADVWQGTHKGQIVCIKMLRISLNDGSILEQSFFKEVFLWRRLKHPNIVAFLGFTIKPRQIVLEWMPNGTLTKYVKTNPGANRVSLLLDMAEGLNYLHANYMIHGDLKGPNVLIDSGGHARLTDLGLTAIVRRVGSVEGYQAQGYTARWTAPEVLRGANTITRKADIFSFGMVVPETFTGRIPFHDLNVPSVMFSIMEGKRPARPQGGKDLGLTDSVWDMTVHCWQEDPALRPTAEEVVEFLRECYRLCTAKSPLSTLVPWRPMENVDNVTNNPPISLMPADEEPTSTKLLDVSQHSGQPNSQTFEISANTSSVSNIAHSGIPPGSPGLSHELLSDKPRPLLTPVHIDHHRAVSTSHDHRGTVGPPGFEEAQSHIDEIAEGLAHGTARSKWNTIIQLRMLCGRHLTVPTTYTLKDVVKEGDRPQCISQVTEIWKGRYNDEAVALKILRVPRDDHVQRNKSRFCKEAVLMKQVEHGNILPFYGVSTAVSDFCLVFPWYENGNIMDYLKKKPDTGRFDLLSGATRGLCFLHENRLVHGALRPSHILIDDNGAARLATAGRSSIVAVPGTSIAAHAQSGGDIDNYRYSAPEVLWPKDHGRGKIFMTKESDVYGMGMVVYEVLTGNMPYSKWNEVIALSKIQVGEMPHQSSDEIADPVWEFLERCWSRDPTKRPSTVQVGDAFSQFHLRPPQVIPTTEGGPVTGELPGKLKLQVQSIRISLDNSKQLKFHVKFKYGNKQHTTPSTTRVMDGDEYTWNGPGDWFIETDKQHHGQSVSLEVLSRSSGVFKKNKVCATGKFSLLNNVGRQTCVELEVLEGIGTAVLKILLVEI